MSENTLQFTKEKSVYVVWTSSDLTEGRGSYFPLYVCESQTTAIRLGKGKYVQGSDCPVTINKAFLIDDSWYAPVHFESATNDDIKQDELNEKKRAIYQKMIEAGLTQAEFDIINTIK